MVSAAAFFPLTLPKVMTCPTVGRVWLALMKHISIHSVVTLNCIFNNSNGLEVVCSTDPANAMFYIEHLFYQL